jgi:hypothetical protein
MEVLRTEAEQVKNLGELIVVILWRQ